MLDVDTAARVLGGVRSGPNVTFSAVNTDSRQGEPGALFVALRGERFDGHAFVAAAMAAGAAAVLVEQGRLPTTADTPMISVPDTEQALGTLAAYWRNRFNVPVVAITGSNGKTTVKDMLALVLSAAAGEEAVLATTGNLNNHIGVPLMLLRLRERHRYAAFEMGMNHLGEISYLARLASPSVALVTNAGVAHLGEVGSRQDIAHAKGEIFGALGATGVAVINADDEYALYWRQLNHGRRIVDFGIDAPAAVSARFELSPAGSLLSLRAPDSEYIVRLHVPGLHNVRNALAAAACAHAVGIAPAEIASGLARYTGTKGRLQRMAARSGATLIDDTYNANPDSVRAAIAVLAAAPGKRVLVLGDMGELGQEGAVLHAQTGEQARRAGIDQLLTLGDLSEAAARAFGDGAQHFRDLDALHAALDRLLSAGTTVLVKGSRFMRMERVVQRLINGESQPAEGGH